MTSAKANALRQQILGLVGEYYRTTHAPRPFDPGQTRVRYASRVYDERELTAGVEAVLDFWLTAGPRAAAFEDGLARFLGLRHALAVNSGSSPEHIPFHESNLALRARESRLYIVTANAADPDGPVNARSGVVSPEGEWLVQCPRDGEQTYAYDLELETE